MPSFNIHLAAAKRYAEKNKNKKTKIENLQSFYDGVVAPDITDNKFVTHYSNLECPEDLPRHIKNRINLQKFLQTNKVETDFEKGVFLHLLTDLLFYTEFFTEDFYKKTNFDEFLANSYYSYNVTNSYLAEKYGIGNFMCSEHEFMDKAVAKTQDRIVKHKCQNIIGTKELDEFIEHVSGLNLADAVKRFS